MDEFAADEAAQSEAISDLGSVKMLNSGFFDKAGKGIDALVPDEGDIGKLKDYIAYTNIVSRYTIHTIHAIFTTYVY